MRILLVSPPSGDLTIGLKHLAKVEPLGLEVIGAAVPDHQVELLDMDAELAVLQKTMAADGIENLPEHEATITDAYLAAQRDLQDALLARLGVARAAAERQADLLFAQLGKYKVGKSCLYVNKLADVDLDVLEKLVALSWDVMNERYPA